jgi:thiol-disulfide isomerase/thioredoxin
MIRRYTLAGVLFAALVALSGAASGFSLPLRATGTNSFAANPTASQQSPEKIWTELQASFLALDPPPSWRTNQPKPEVYNVWHTNKIAMELKFADLARDFYLHFPGTEQAALARQSEYNLLEMSVEAGKTNLLPRLAELDRDKLADLTLTDEERFDLLSHIVERNANSRMAEGNRAVMSWLEKGSRDLLREYPNNPQSWKFLVTVADQDENPERARRLVNEIMKSRAAEEYKISVRRILKRLDHIGKPVSLHGVAMDGRKFDVRTLKGRVVLLHFWDTWCGYCVEELPAVKAVYEKYHDRGMEIVSVSFDPSRADLVKFLAQEKMPWLHYFAGPDWDKQFGRDIDIAAMPTLWLVDKRGKLRQLNAREHLGEKIEKLLAE